MEPDWNRLKEFKECVGKGWWPLVETLVDFAKNGYKSYEEDMKLLAKWEAEENYCAGWKRVKELKEESPTNPYTCVETKLKKGRKLVEAPQR
jgi:hypothetical protein